jgi:peroxiredoxin family protein
MNSHPSVIISPGKRVPTLLGNLTAISDVQKAPQAKQKLLLVVSKGTMDGLYPALILATTAAAQEWASVDMYFTFGGMKLLTKGMAESIKPSVDFGVSKDELTALLAKGGMPSLLDMLKGAKDAGVHIYACSPTMGLYGMSKDQVLDICDDIIGASKFLQMASDPDALTLFI